MSLINITTSGYPQASGWYFWYPPLNTFDGDTESFWQSDTLCSDSYPVWISYYWVANSFILSQYKINVNGTQRPIAWILQGSNDGHVWNDIDTQTDQTGVLVEWMTYSVTTNQYYNYIRLYITESSDSSLPVRINEIQFYSLASDTTTTTSTSTVTTTTSTNTTTQTSTTQYSTISTTSSTLTTTYTTTTATTTVDPSLLWQPQTKLDIVRDQINNWYKSGIPVTWKQVESLPTFISSYVGIPVYVTSEDKYYLGTEHGWEQLNLGNVPHGPHHATTGDDELIHLGLDTPSAVFTGKVWLYTEYDITTTTTSATTTQTSTTTTTVTTASTTSTITYTYTTTQSTTTTQSSTSSTTITQSNYTVNVLPGCNVTADSHALSFDPSNAIDNLDWTKWITNPSTVISVFPHWIKFVLPYPKVVYIINLFWDYARYSDNWYLEGSNDGLIWDSLYHKNNYIPIPNLYNEYVFSNNKAYSQYRFRFISGNDLRTNSIGIYGVQLLADAIPTSSTSTTTTTTGTTTTGTTTTGTTTAPLGYVNVAPSSTVMAIDQYPNYPATNVVDSNENSEWICDPYIGPPYWLLFYWPNEEHYVVDQYYLYINTLGRPRNWKLQGSLDGINWDILDTQTDIETEGWWESVITNTTSYGYYRLLIEQTQSTGYSVRLGIVELWIHESYRSTSTSTTLTTSTTTTLTTASTTLTTFSTTASTTYPVPIEMTFLMNFNGEDSSIQTTDDTSRHHSIDWSGSSIITTGKYKYGTASLYLPYQSYYPSSSVLNSYVEVPNSYDWRLGAGSGDFTIDFWVCWGLNNNLFMNWNNLITYYQDLDNYWSLRYYPNGHLLGFSLRQEGLLSVNYNVTCQMISSQWNYVCLVRNNNNFLFYVNGVACGSSQPYNVEFPYSSTGLLWIGQGPSEYLNTAIDYTQSNCYLDSMRISTGALFTGPMQLPPEPTTSTTVSTTTNTTTTTSLVAYSYRLILPCNDAETYLYDYTGRHGIVSLPDTGTSLATRFAVYTDMYVEPKFENTYLLSTYDDPYDYRTSVSNYLQIADSDDWKLGDDGNNDFTIESWIAYRSPFYEYGTPILSHYQDSGNFWALYVSYGNNQFLFKVRENGNSLIEYSSSINYNTLDWNYFSFNRWNGRLRVFWNGNVNGYWVDYSSIEIPSFTGPLYLFGGPSLTNYNQIIPSGIACSGLRIAKGLVPGTTNGLIPSISF